MRLISAGTRRVALRNLLVGAGAWLLALIPPAVSAESPLARDFEAAGAWLSEPYDRLSVATPYQALYLTEWTYREPRPIKLWVARIDLTQPGVRFAATTGRPTTRRSTADAESEVRQFETRSATTVEFAMQRGTQLAINTSPFAPFRQSTGQPMDVRGLAAVGGKTYSPPEQDYGALLIDADGKLRLSGPPLSTEGHALAVGGFRMLLDDGALVVDAELAETRFGGLHPRTAIGLNADASRLWIVVADGRQAGSAEGLTLVELAALFKQLGAFDALNLDGGGSTTLVLEDALLQQRVLNTPVGQRRQPGSLRQVAHNFGLYLPRRARASAREDASVIQPRKRFIQELGKSRAVIPPAARQASVVRALRSAFDFRSSPAVPAELQAWADRLDRSPSPEASLQPLIQAGLASAIKDVFALERGDLVAWQAGDSIHVAPFWARERCSTGGWTLRVWPAPTTGDGNLGELNAGDAKLRCISLDISGAFPPHVFAVRVAEK